MGLECLLQIISNMQYKLEKEIAGSYEYPVRTQYGYMAGNPVCSSEAATSMVSTSIKHA